MERRDRTQLPLIFTRLVRKIRSKYFVASCQLCATNKGTLKDFWSSYLFNQICRKAFSCCRVGVVTFPLNREGWEEMWWKRTRSRLVWAVTSWKPFRLVGDVRNLGIEFQNWRQNEGKERNILFFNAESKYSPDVRIAERKSIERDLYRRLKGNNLMWQTVWRMALMGLNGGIQGGWPNYLLLCSCNSIVLNCLVCLQHDGTLTATHDVEVFF